MSNATEHEVITDRPPAPKKSRVTKIIRTIGWTSIGLGLFLVGFVVHQLFITTYFAQQNNETLKVEAAEYFEQVTISEVEYVAPGAPSLIVPQDPAAPVEPVGSRRTQDVTRRRGAPERRSVRHHPDPVDREARRRLDRGRGSLEGRPQERCRAHASTPLPGQPGNSVLPGHRTTYGAPFHELDELEVGDIIEVETAIGLNIYEVRESIIVRPTEIWVTNPRPGSWITLTTCNPKFSSRERLIIFAELVSGPNYDVIYNS